MRKAERGTNLPDVFGGCCIVERVTHALTGEKCGRGGECEDVNQHFVGKVKEIARTVGFLHPSYSSHRFFSGCFAENNRKSKLN